MSKTLFSSDHEYVKIDGDSATIGISDYAQEQLGDIVYVELPAVGAAFKKGDEIAVVESVKAASEIYAPVAMTVIAINSDLEGDPAKVNADAMGEGWLIKVKIDEASELDDLMDQDAYSSHIA
ncbi:Glycine cleavage system H protein [hydrothermal vent metagenome]|uniref:Glycine cleavage system H protein n=1 Tax=hydrothermal vent metagenome TaxID=652676 RepID=A0A3B0URD0_9ZZZZ